MKILIFQPHDTLMAPQGALTRLNGLLSVLKDQELAFLAPENSAASVDRLVAGGELFTFREPRIFGHGIPYLLDSSPGLVRIFDQVIEHFKPDAAIFNFPWGLSAFKRRTGLKAIYFSHGVERDFAAVTLEHLRINRLPVRSPFTRWIHYLEDRACSAADSVFTMSPVDAGRLRQLYNLSPDKLWYFPQPVSMTDSQAVSNSGERTRKQEYRTLLGLPDDSKLVLFHGSWAHQPNREAVSAIRDVIAPICRAADGRIRFVIGGTGVPADLGGDLISVGFVEDINCLVGAADAAVIPVFKGSGVRMKAFDYLRAGCPIVSTQKGIEGLPLRNGIECLITANDPAAVAGAVIELVQNDQLQLQLSGAAKEYIKSGHDPETIRQETILRLKSIVH